MGKKFHFFLLEHGDFQTSFVLEALPQLHYNLLCDLIVHWTLIQHFWDRISQTVDTQLFQYVPQHYQDVFFCLDFPDGTKVSVLVCHCAEGL